MVSCGNQSEDSSAEKVNAPSFLSYNKTSLELEKNIPFDFIFPTIVGEKVSFSSKPLLPRGIYLNSSNGTISGIPKEVSPETVYKIIAENESGKVEFDIQIVVTERPVPSISYQNTKYTFTIGELIESIDLTTTGAEFESFSILKLLPSGLSFNSETGSITGTPNQIIANYTATVEAKTTDGNSVYTTISLDINDIPPESLFYPVSQIVLKRNTEMDSNIPSSGGGNIVFYSISPSLPNGLAFNSSTGEISGTPLSVRVPSNFVITGTNSGGSTNTTVSIEVQDLPPQGLSYGATNFIFTKTVQVNPVYPSLAGGGIATEYSISPAFDNGLNFNTTTGEISGIPNKKESSKTYTITAINSGGSTSTQISIFIKDLPPQNLSYDIVSNIYVKNSSIGTLNPTSEGGEILAYSISPELPDGITFNETTGLISGTPSVTSEARSYTVTATNNQGSSQYSFFIAIKDEAPRNLDYSQTDIILTKGSLMPQLSPTNDGGLITSYVSSPLLPSGLTINKTTGNITGTPSQVIPRTPFIINGSNATGEVSKTIFIKINDIPPTNLSYGITSYTFDRGITIPNLLPTNDGGTITNYSISPSLPNGLSIDNVTGEISGIPTVYIEETEFTISGINTGGTVSTTLNISINDYPPQDLFYGDIPYKLQKNKNLGEGLLPVYSGGTILNFSITPELPEGLYIDQSNGAIKGTPVNKTSQFINYTVTGTNSGGSTSANITINITDEPPIVEYAQLEYTFTRLQNVNIVPTNISGGAIVSWQRNPTTLPSGLTFNESTGVISGNPDTVQSTPLQYSFLAINDGGNAENIFTITILPIQPSSLTYSNSVFEFPKEVRTDPEDPSTSNYQSPLSLIPTISGDPVDSWSISPELPSGLSFNISTGEISGIPTEGTGVINYTVTATNLGGSDSFNFSLKIKDVPPTNLEYLPNDYALDTGDNIFIAAPFNEGGTIKTYSITPNLPNGLEFNTSSGEISKVSPVLGQSRTEYTITGSNDEGSTSTSLFLTLVESPPTNLVYGEESDPFGQAVTYFTYGIYGSTTPTNEGGGLALYEDVQYYRIDKGPDYLANREDTIKVDIETIPTGLNFNSTTGELSGTIVKDATSDNKFYGLDVKGSNDGGVTFTYTLIFFNDRPIANAGTDLEGTIGEVQTLSGSNTDIDDDDDEWPFTDTDVGRLEQYEWFLVSKPEGSSITTSSITNRFTKNPSFTPDAIGEFIFELETDDGIAKSEVRDSVKVTIVDVPPSNLSYGFSSHGFDVFLYNIDDTFTLNPSSDGGEVVSYSINQSLPNGLSFNTSTGVISGTILSPFEPIQLEVTATNTGGSTTKIISIWGNNPPIANITTSSNKLEFGNNLLLDGSSSIDSDFNFSQSSPYNTVPVEFTYQWSVVSKPAGSTLTNSSFSDGNGEITGIIPDKKGTYVFGLVVNDGFIDSEIKTITIKTASSPKNLTYGNIGYGTNNFAFNKNQSVSLTPTLEGDSALFSVSPELPNGISLNTTTGSISGSSASASTSQSYTITATNDGGNVSVNIKLWINETPTIVYQEEELNLIVGNSFTLSTLSIDDIDMSTINTPPFNSLSSVYTWSLEGIPSESSLEISDFQNTNDTNLKFTPDVEGIYILKLKYNDGLIDASNEAIVSFKTTNFQQEYKPLAKILNNNFIREVSILDDVELDLSNSEIFKGSISYLWEIIKQPDLSISTLVDETSSITTLNIDQEGYYLIKGTVSDGTDSSSIYIGLYTQSSVNDFLLTEVNSNLNITIDDSPVLINNNFEIINGATLTIEPGVLILGNNKELRVSNGKLISGQELGNQVLIDNLKINSGDSVNTDFEINNNYLVNSSFCEVNFNLSSECSGRFVFKNNVMINSNNVESIIGNSIKELNISKNIFINSHGFELLTISNPITVSENYINNPIGGKVGLDPYFLIITQNDSDSIKVNKNFFDDENINDYQFVRISPTLNTNVDLTINNWNKFIEKDNFLNWILNNQKSVSIPFATDIPNNIKSGKQYISN